MTTTVTHRPSTARARRDGRLRRIRSLARSEAVLLRRSPTALAIALIGPLGLVLVPFSNGPVPDSAGRHGAGALVVTGAAAFTLIYTVYYNLVTALVARREELVLKRLRTGELSDVEILAGTASPAVGIAWAQIAVAMVAALAFLHMPTPPNPVLVLVAVVMGTAVLVMLAAVSTALASSTEMAQLAASPVLVGFTMLSGVMIPLDTLPEPVHRLAQALPVPQVVELLRLGLTGTSDAGNTIGLAASFGAATVPVLVLTVWLAAGGLAARRWFRWEPRR